MISPLPRPFPALALVTALLALPALARPPRLTVLITVDSLGSEVLLRTRPRLKGGLGQLLQSGAYFPVSRYEVVETVTGVGHSSISTGAWPWRHGITGNRYYNRASGKVEPVFHDPTHPVLGAPVGVDDASPSTLLAETVGDRLRSSTGMKGKVVAIAGKGRAAVALAGRLGQAWWFSDQVGHFVTGTWYFKEVPAWAQAVAEKKSADAYHGKSWELLGAPKDYAGEDDRPAEVDTLGLGRTFPHPLSGGLPSVGTQSYAALMVSPMMNEVMVEFIKAAIEGEQLGKDEVPDLLAISFSSLDLTYHTFGPSSWEEQDHLLRLDRSIGEVLAACDRAAGGRANVVVALSSDHGGAELPEVWAAMGQDASRVSPQALGGGLKDMLEKRFGAGASSLLAAWDGADVYLSPRVLEERKLDGATVRRAVAAHLAAQPDVAEAIARDDLDAASSSLAQAFRHSFHPLRGGDVLVALRPFRVTAEKGTMHGSPWSYDTEVPLVLSGRGIKPGLYTSRPAVVDLAPTLSVLLEQGSPASSEGSVITEALAPVRP